MHGTSNSKAFNQKITLEEVMLVVKGSKNGKTVNGNIDPLPNEIVKNDISIKLLHSLFSKFFPQYGIRPSVHGKATIYPLVKSAKNDTLVPLLYRGISLLSHVEKMYTSLLNNRLIAYLESSNILVEEQNGCRKNRSTTEHIFTLTLIVDVRLSKNIDTFVEFMDFQKAFDWVNRDCLF